MIETNINKEFLIDNKDGIQTLKTGEMVEFRETETIMFSIPLIIINQVDEVYIMYAIENHSTTQSFSSSKDHLIFPLFKKSTHFYGFFKYKEHILMQNDLYTESSVKTYTKEYKAYIQERIESLLSSQHSFNQNKGPKKKTAINYDRAIGLYRKRVPKEVLPLFTDKEEYEILLLTKKRGDNINTLIEKNKKKNNKAKEGVYNSPHYKYDEDNKTLTYHTFTAQMIADSKWDRLIIYINYHGIILPVPAIYLIPSKIKMI